MRALDILSGHRKSVLAFVDESDDNCVRTLQRCHIAARVVWGLGAAKAGIRPGCKSLRQSLLRVALRQVYGAGGAELSGGARLGRVECGRHGLPAADRPVPV